VASSAVMVLSMRAEAVRRADAQLQAVAALKVDAIATWIGIRVQAARYACTYPVVQKAAREASAGRVQPELAAHVVEVLGHLADRWRYAAVGLVDGHGRPIALAGADAVPVAPVDARLLEAAAAAPGKDAVHLEILGDGRASLEVAVVAEAGGATARCFLRADAASMLDAVVERWPVPSETGSAALLRVEGGDALIFLARRDRPPEGFLRVSLQDRSRAAVRALGGDAGLIEAKDFRGAPFLIRARPIPGADWMLRTRIDLEEVMAPLRRPTRAIVGLVAAFLVAGGALLFRWWRDEGRRAAVEAELELAQRMAGLGRLAAGVAHEINNPLSSVVANLTFVAEALAEGPPDVRQALAEARDGAGRVGDVVRSLRTFSRPLAAPRGPVDVREELEAAIRLAGHELRHRAELKVEIGPVPKVLAEAHELGQVFLNLIVNAFQAIPEDRPGDHRVSIHARTDPRGWAAIDIRDTGVGIPPDVVTRIFEPFFTTKPLGVGTGLGLAIAHGIVTGAGGRIEVESRLGQGSTFRVVLPPAAAGPGAPSRGVPGPSDVTAPPAPAPGQGPRGRILVVDDEVLVARAAVRVLSAYDVVVASSAGEALRHLEGGERFDAVLCDLMMPGMTGMELHARIAAQAPAQAARFIFVTGGAFTETAAAFLRTTRNAWIEKPYDAGALRAAVERAIAS
jgi:signal transduction histidine kinase/CheY-like chemotaxis protein